MQPELRGVVEQYIDFALSDAQMVGHQRYAHALRPYAKSIEDTVLGLVVGMIVASCIDQIIFFTRGIPTPDQLDRLREIVMEKIPRIRSRVLETLI